MRDVIRDCLFWNVVVINDLRFDSGIFDNRHPSLFLILSGYVKYNINKTMAKSINANTKAIAQHFWHFLLFAALSSGCVCMSKGMLNGSD